MAEKPREVYVKRIADGFIARRVDVTGWSERRIMEQIGGMLINVDTDNWIVVDSAWADAPAPTLER